MVSTDDSAQDGPRTSVRRVQYGYSMDQVATSNRNRRRRRKHRVLKLMTRAQIDVRFPVQCFKQAHEKSQLNPVNQAAEVVKNEKATVAVSETVVVPPASKRSLLPFLSRTNSVQTTFEMASDLEAQTKTVAQPPVRDNTSDEFDDEEDQSACLNLDTEGSLDMCAICIDKLEDNDQVRLLGCGHIFHAECIDPWLLTRQACCPMCKLSFYAPKPEDPMGPDPVHVIEAQYLAGLRAQEADGATHTDDSGNANSNSNNDTAARTTWRWFGRRTPAPATQIDSPASITNTATTPASTPIDRDTVATPSIPASNHDTLTASSQTIEPETVSGSEVAMNVAVTPDASTLATSR